MKNERRTRWTVLTLLEAEFRLELIIGAVLVLGVLSYLILESPLSFEKIFLLILALLVFGRLGWAFWKDSE
jgi:hypothetical protein